MVRPLAVAVLLAALAAGPLLLHTVQPAGVISGVVTDELNRPMPGVSVAAFRLSESGVLEPKEMGSYPTNPPGNLRKDTNDLGEFRLWPLAAGEYVVAVVASRSTHTVDNADSFGCMVPAPPLPSFTIEPFVREPPIDTLVDATRRHRSRISLGLTGPSGGTREPRGYVTTFSPRSVTLAEARRISLRDKLVHDGIDIQLQLRPTVRVTGRVAGLTAQGPLDIELRSEVGGARTVTTPDGSFVFLDIPVGPYALVSPGKHADCDVVSMYPESHRGQSDVNVERADINHFVMTLGPQVSVQRGLTVPSKPAEAIPDAGRIEGVVTTDAGVPLDRVRVRVTSSALPAGVTAVTQTDGRFTIGNLPPGSYTLTGARAGFLDRTFGQRGSDGPGTLIQINAGQRFSATLIMPRPGVITGMVTNERGEPMPGVSVCCDGKAWADTDDRGRYRLWLAPSGERTLRASAIRNQAAFKGYIPTFFPGVIDESQAKKVPVMPGSVLVADIEAQPAITSPDATLEVVVRRTDGWNAPAVVYLAGAINARQETTSSETEPKGGQVATFKSVPPGRHGISVYYGNSWSGGEFVVTDGRSPTRVTMVVAPPSRLLVGVTLEGPGQSARGFSWRLFRVGDGAGWTSVQSSNGSWADLNADGRASLPDQRPGRYVLRIEADGTWVAKSATLDGRELLDGTFSLEPGSTNDLVLTFTKSVTSLEGQVRNEAGYPAAGADVLIFSADRQFWTPGSRRIRIIRARTDGRYQVTHLPPGEYAVVAEQEIDPDDIDPVWLQVRLAGSARVTLVEDKKQELGVRVRRAPR